MLTDLLYSSDGTPVLRLLADGRLIDVTGRSVAWVDPAGNVFDYEGNHRGWYLEGMVIGFDGGVILFGERPGNVHPPFPSKRPVPPQSVVGLEPPRPFRKPVLLPPARRLMAWSRMCADPFWVGLVRGTRLLPRKKPVL